AGTTVKTISFSGSILMPNTRCCSLRPVPRPNNTVPPCAPAFIVASRTASPHPLRTILTTKRGLSIAKLLFSSLQPDQHPEHHQRHHGCQCDQRHQAETVYD